MFSGVGSSEILIILLIILVLFGSRRIPEFSRAVGKTVHAIRKAFDEIREEIDSQTPAEPPKPGSDKAG